MMDAIAVGVIVTAAVAYILYRYCFKKSGGCSCGCSGHAAKKCCGGGETPHSCDCRK